MNSALLDKQVCSCGRAFTHCKNEGCGSKNVYPKKARSFEESEIQGRVVYVYGCRRCMREFTNEQVCLAPSREFNPQLVPEIKQKKIITEKVLPSPLGSVIPGSDEHHALLSDWVTEHGKGLGHVQVFVEAQKAGWQIEAFGDAVDPLVKQALVERGLWKDSKDASVTDQSGNANASAEAESPNETQASLDEIIKAMNEEQK